MSRTQMLKRISKLEQERVSPHKELTPGSPEWWDYWSPTLERLAAGDYSELTWDAFQAVVAIADDFKPR